MPDVFKTIRGQAFGAERVPADGKEFVDCTFANTVLVFRGKAEFHIASSGEFSIEFAGPAKVVFNQLCAMHHFGMHELVEQIFTSIRNPTGIGIQ